MFRQDAGPEREELCKAVNEKATGRLSVRVCGAQRDHWPMQVTSVVVLPSLRRRRGRSKGVFDMTTVSVIIIIESDRERERESESQVSVSVSVVVSSLSCSSSPCHSTPPLGGRRSGEEIMLLPPWQPSVSRSYCYFKYCLVSLPYLLLLLLLLLLL